MDSQQPFGGDDKVSKRVRIILNPLQTSFKYSWCFISTFEFIKIIKKDILEKKMEVDEHNLFYAA